jgi:hypothetical protein
VLRTTSPGSEYLNVPSKRLQYLGTAQTVATMSALALGPRGEQSPMVRRHAERIVANLRPKDYASELMAIFYWWCRAGRYTRDPLHVELLKDPERLVTDGENGQLVLDCDEFALGIATDCMVVGAPAQFVTVGFRARPPGAPEGFTHVFARAQDPRTGVWWILDPVAGVRAEAMLKRVKQYRIYEIG